MPDPRIRQKLIGYIQDAQAMERNVLMMLNSMIFSTSDPELVEAMRAHKRETEEQDVRLRERLKALGSGSSTTKQATAVAPTLLKGVLDQVRPDKPNRNARDAFTTEHLEIAVYEILERIATRAGDDATAAVARMNRAEEERFATFIAANWDRVVDLTLAGDGIAPTRRRRAAAPQSTRARRGTRSTSSGRRARASATTRTRRRRTATGARGTTGSNEG